jgi:hypothetical protein
MLRDSTLRLNNMIVEWFLDQRVGVSEADLDVVRTLAVECLFAESAKKSGAESGFEASSESPKSLFVA